MYEHKHLATAFYASLVALAMLVAIIVLSAAFGAPANQEQFEVFSPVAGYGDRLLAAGDGLRWVLFCDILFMMGYTSAVCFAALGFAENNRAAALVASIGIICVMLLDGLENSNILILLDMRVAGEDLTRERIAYQTGISAMKWIMSAATLVATSFVLPSEKLLEKVMIWGVRIGMPVSVGLFLMNPSGLREFGGIGLLLSMASGSILLAAVLRGRMVER